MPKYDSSIPFEQISQIRDGEVPAETYGPAPMMKGTRAVSRVPASGSVISTSRR